MDLNKMLRTACPTDEQCLGGHVSCDKNRPILFEPYEQREIASLRKFENKYWLVLRNYY